MDVGVWVRGYQVRVSALRAMFVCEFEIARAKLRDTCFFVSASV